MKTFTIHYNGGTEKVCAFGKNEALSIFHRLLPGTKHTHITQ